MFLHALDEENHFPPVNTALSEPDGLLSFSAQISIDRLESAYRQGIFPWYSEGQPVLWWSPRSRMVLACHDFHVSHSLRKRLKKIVRDQSLGNLKSCVVTVDCAFDAVLDSCATRGAKRFTSQHLLEPKSTIYQVNDFHQVTTDQTKIQGNENPETEDLETYDAGHLAATTWITPHMQDAYKAWHQLGRVHSIETWQYGELVGGLYGVSIGATFFGESMFARETDASKIALAHLVQFLQRHHVKFIDCQMVTNHLSTLGARPIDRLEFIARVAQGIHQPDLPWQAGWLNYRGEITPTNDLLALPFTT
jgi:leucyl/phenylalanyl-tRNA--protein transferase